MMSKWLAVVAMIGFVVCGSHTAAVAGTNPALLVVNSAYESLAHLPTTENDGRRLTSVLRSRPGFSANLEPQRNLTTSEFKSRWDAFRVQVLDMKTDGVAVFYFSGHGVEIDGDSYLVPIDIPKGASEAALRGSSVSLRGLFRDVRGWQEVLANRAVKVNAIFIIDACREIPVPQPTIATKSTKGFAPVVAAPIAPPSSNTPSGMIVLYAASAGQVAHTVIDGKTDGNPPSVYTKHLAALLEEGLAVQTSAARVRWLVHNEVAKAMPALPPQTPAYYDELLQTIDVWGKEQSGTPKSTPPVPISRKVDASEPIWECETCPHLVVVPPGKFMMGSLEKEPGHEPYESMAGPAATPVSSGPPVGSDLRLPVAIAQAFAIGTREVTRGEFQAYIRDKYGRACPSTLIVCSATVESLNRPITNVSWNDVNDYIAWLNATIGLSKDKPERGYYRLPTEAEWEYAARGGVESRFVSGDDVSKLCLYGNGADQSLNTMTLLSTNNTCNDGRGRELADVQSYKPNGFGLYDVHGNAWEWVQDCWSERLGADKSQGQATAGGAGQTDATCLRSARGGSWRSAPAALRLAKRVAFPPDHRRITLGFRVARTLASGEVVSANK
ncbi:MAG: SUMF1/EgtB/PvdO family nonheme iron enzyme [Hyphomicrobiaceae bacterium]|nr:SUMF1/EgtB/PvdO family nonheme iron enzyme [Hyphomicrobiaceae bacterium]